MSNNGFRKLVLMTVLFAVLVTLGVVAEDCPDNAHAFDSTPVRTAIGSFRVEMCVVRDDITQKDIYTFTVMNVDLACPIQSFAIQPIAGVDAELMPSPPWQAAKEETHWWIWDGPSSAAIPPGGSRAFVVRAPEISMPVAISGTVWTNPRSSCGANQFDFNLGMLGSEPLVNHTSFGVISRNETWQGEMHVIGDIIVAKGATLTIEPGTTVLIAANSDANNLFHDPRSMRQGIVPLDYSGPGPLAGERWMDEGNHVSIYIEGTLYAVGTPDSMILITSDSPNPGRYDWNLFEFCNGIISYAILEYYRTLEPRDGTVVSHSILRHNGGCAACFNSDQSAVVEYNTIYDTSHELIDIGGAASPIIRNNHLGPNAPVTYPAGNEGGGTGIALNGGESFEIAGNVIEDCHTGILFVIPPTSPYETLVPLLCQGNTFKNNFYDIFDRVRGRLSCRFTSGDEETNGNGQHPDQREHRN